MSNIDSIDQVSISSESSPDSDIKSIDRDSIYFEARLESEPKSSPAQWLNYGGNLRIVPSHHKTINTYLPMELLREIFLDCIEVNQTKSVQLASVCHYWRSVITIMSHLWSTLRVGSLTEREQVATWLQRAYPKKVVIDTQRDGQGQLNTPRFEAFQDALASTGQWHKLSISSFPPDNLASQLDFQNSGPMNVLKVLHVAAGCFNSLYFTHLLDLVPTEAPISEMRLYSSFAITYFLQPHQFPVLQKLTVLIVNGRGIHEPFELLPAFTQLQILEVEHLPLPWYEPNADLPLIHTLQKLRLKGSSVQWMAGREFQSLGECVILFPHHWVAWKQHGVQLPSCIKLTYHGYPMTTAQYLHAPCTKVMGLGSNDYKEERVYQHLHHLCTLDQTMFNLTVLHLTLECSEQAFVKVLKYLGPLQELLLSTARHSPSWQGFLELLAANPSARDWPQWCEWDAWDKWDKWCSTRTWHSDVLLHLKHLTIQYSKGFSPSGCLGNCVLFRLVAWTRSQLSSPLEQLKVCEGRGTTEGIVMDYISSGYLGRHLGILNQKYDSKIIRGMVTQSLVIEASDPLWIYQLHWTALFGRLQALIISVEPGVEIWILPDLEQIKRLEIQCGVIPTYSLNMELPLVHTLRWLRLVFSTFSWMLGRTFKALEDCTFSELMKESADIFVNNVNNEMQVNLPACRSLKCTSGYATFYCLFSCPNVQFLQWMPSEHDYTLLAAAPKLLPDLLLNSLCLQELEITISQYFGLDSLIHLILCDSLKSRRWKTLKSVEMKVHCDADGAAGRFFDQMVGNQQYYRKGWSEFMVSKAGLYHVKLRAWM